MHTELTFESFLTFLQDKSLSTCICIKLYPPRAHKSDANYIHICIPVNIKLTSHTHTQDMSMKLYPPRVCESDADNDDSTPDLMHLQHQAQGAEERDEEVEKFWDLAGGFFWGFVLGFFSFILSFRPHAPPASRPCDYTLLLYTRTYTRTYRVSRVQKHTHTHIHTHTHCWGTGRGSGFFLGIFWG